MPTLPIVAVYCLNGTHLIFQYADQTRSNPIELTEENIKSFSFTKEEEVAYLAAKIYPNNWVNVA